MPADFNCNTAGRVLFGVSRMGAAESGLPEIRLMQRDSIGPIVPEGVAQLRLRDVSDER